MNKIVFFLASLSQPRCIKRINALNNAGYEVVVYGYYRGYYDINTFPNNIEVHQWGEIPSGSGYLKRFINNNNNINMVLQKYKNEKILYYAFGLDLAFCLSMNRKIRFIYESSDLIYTYWKNKIILNVFKYIDKKIIFASYKTVFTSEGFHKYLYGNKKNDKIIIQPNRISPYLKNIKRNILELKDNNGLVFSYVGAFRYPNTVFRFAKVIGEKYPQHKFYFHGDSPLTYLAKDLSENYSNIFYFGKFRSPEDLESIYKNIDIVIACYDTKDVNERIAEPNKLYEAICFCKPIVVSKGTFLSEQVEKMKVGYCINADNDESICNFIDNINYSEVQNISRNELEISSNVYIDSIDNIKAVVDDYFN